MAYLSSSSAVATVAGNITATPAGVVAGHVLVGCIAIDFSGHTVTAPTGWATAVSNNQGTPDGQEFWWSWKVATGSDSFTWNVSGGGNDTVLINAAFSGRDNASPININQASVNTSSNTSPVSISATGGTALAGDDLAVFLSLDMTAGTDTWTFGSWGGSLVERQDVQQGWAVMGLATQDAISAGATGSQTATATRGSGSGNAGWAGFVISIKAAAGGVVVPRLMMMGMG